MLAMLLLLFSVGGNAAFYTEEELEAIELNFTEKCDTIREKVNHREYFDGGCAEWVSDQLKLNGVGYWYKGNESFGFDDGNRWFADLDEGAVTKSGYRQVKYAGSEALSDIVAEFGGYPVYNVVACWEKGNDKWEASGHVVYIWAIIDGYVYYADTFDQFLHEAGHMIKQPLEQFVSVYADSSGSMIGAVHFEGAEAVHFHADNELFSTYTAISDCTLRAAPVTEVNGKDTAVETAPAGTVFTVLGSCAGMEGSHWFKTDGGCWISSADVRKTSNLSTIGATDISVPETWNYHTGFTMTGTVFSYSGDLSRVSLTITNEAGEVLVGGEQEISGSTYSVSALDENTYFEHFAPGQYRYTIIAENAYESATVLDTTFTIVNGTYKDCKQYTLTEEKRAFSCEDVDRSGAVDLADVEATFDAVANGAGDYFTDVNGDSVYNLTDIYRVASKSAQ